MLGVRKEGQCRQGNCMCTGIKACEIYFFFVTSFQCIAERLKLVLTTIDIPIISIHSFHPSNQFYWYAGTMPMF